MSEEERSSLLDRLVEQLAGLMDAVGLNGTRLRWRWRQRRHRHGESDLQREILWRSAKGKHKMCPGCRALVPRAAETCPDCGASLAAVRGPGLGRAIGNLLPGITAVTSILLLVNGFWFVIMLMAQLRAGGAGGGLFGGFDGEMLAHFGSGLSRPVRLSSGLVTGGEWWRLITPIFLHGGLLHFFFNSYLLLQLGPVVEEIYGTERYWVIYLTCGIAGSLTSQLPRFVNTVGASGAIMGLIGLLLVYGWRRGGVLGESMRGLLTRLIFYSIVLSLFFNIDHLNHIGGFACGALLALVVRPGPARHPGEAAVWRMLALAGVLAVLGSFYMVSSRIG